MALIFLYIFLAIVAIIAAVILLVYYAPISLRIRYKDILRMWEKVYFFTIKEYPKKKRKRKKRKKKGAAKSSDSVSSASDEGGKTPVQADDDDDDEEEDFEPVESVQDTLALFLELLKCLLDIVGDQAKIKIDKLLVVVSRPDAADTAVLYGVCGGMVSTILALASNFSVCDIKEKNVGVTADFTGGNNSLDVDVTLSARLIVVYSCLLKAYMIHEAKKRRTERMDKE